MAASHGGLTPPQRGIDAASKPSKDGVGFRDHLILDLETQDVSLHRQPLDIINNNNTLLRSLSP